MTQHFLLREQSPLTNQQWNQIDTMINQTARRLLIGRRVLPIYGPLGAGVSSVEIVSLAAPEDATVSFWGQNSATVTVSGRTLIPIPLIYRDFVLHWRSLEQTTQLGLPVDLAAVLAAATAVARKEDELIFRGREGIGQIGLLNAPGRTTVPLGDWGQPGGAFQNFTEAVAKLGSLGFSGPFALITSPRLFATMSRVFDNTGLLEIDQIRRVAKAGVFLTSALPEPTAMVLSVGGENFDLAVSQDMVTAYLQSENLNHTFRVMEAVALRVSRPQAIVTFEKAQLGI